MNSSLIGSNINSVKAHNLQVVLLNLLYEGELSRSELARLTNLSNTTITNLIGELIDEGLVQECDFEEAVLDVTRPVGRPRTAVCLQPNARFVIGVHVGVGVFRVAVNNLRDEIVFSDMESYDIQNSPIQVLDQIIRCIQSLIAEHQISPEKILGLGVGLSGIVDFNSGVNVFAPNLNWRQVPAKAYLASHLNMPVVVDNNVRCMALGEAYFGSGRGLDSLVFVYGRVGVGAGFIYKGQVFRGSAMGAGEFGHNIVIIDDESHINDRGIRELESLVSEKVIFQQADEILSANPNGICAKLMESNPELDRMDCLIQAARQGDVSVQKMFADRAYYLGVALSNMVNLYNPELILLGGLFAQAEELILEPVTQTVRQMAFANLGNRVRVEVTKFGWKAGVIGAAALALTNFFYLND